MTNDIKQRYRDKGYRDKREYRDKDIEIIRITRRYPISYNLCRTSVHIHSYNSSVLMKLSKLNPTKANRPRGIPGCLLKEDANLFSGPIKQYWTLPTEAIFRSLGSLQISFLYQNRNLCKKKKNGNKHLRPISLTSILSNVAEDFVVESIVKPAVVRMSWKQPVWNDFEILNNSRLWWLYEENDSMRKTQRKNWYFT